MKLTTTVNFPNSISSLLYFYRLYLFFMSIEVVHSYFWLSRRAAIEYATVEHDDWEYSVKCQPKLSLGSTLSTSASRFHRYNAAPSFANGTFSGNPSLLLSLHEHIPRRPWTSPDVARLPDIKGGRPSDYGHGFQQDPPGSRGQCQCQCQEIEVLTTTEQVSPRPVHASHEALSPEHARISRRVFAIERRIVSEAKNALWRTRPISMQTGGCDGSCEALQRQVSLQPRPRDKNKPMVFQAHLCPQRRHERWTWIQSNDRQRGHGLCSDVQFTRPRAALLPATTSRHCSIKT